MDGGSGRSRRVAEAGAGSERAQGRWVVMRSRARAACSRSVEAGWFHCGGGAGAREGRPLSVNMTEAIELAAAEAVGGRR